MRIDYIRDRIKREGYHLTFCNGTYFAKKNLRTYKADSLNGLYDILFRNKKYM